jgi:hypothetical protein
MMMSQLSTSWREMPPRRRLIVKLAVGFLALLFLFFVAPRLWNRVLNWRWGKGTERVEQGIANDKAEAEKWKAVATEALGELKEAKRELSEETRKREEAERILADTHKATNAARAEYGRVRDAPPRPPDPNAGTDDLCAEARRLGVFCPD